MIKSVRYFILKQLNFYFLPTGKEEKLKCYFIQIIIIDSIWVLNFFLKLCFALANLDK